MRRLLIHIVAATLAAGSHQLIAEKSGYYRWTDDNGKPQFTQLPPEDRPSQWVETQTGRKVDVESPSEARVDEAEEKKQQLAGEIQGVHEKDSKACADARGNLETLKFSRVRIRDEEGNVRFLTEAEKEEQRARAQEVADINCD